MDRRYLLKLAAGGFLSAPILSAPWPLDAAPAKDEESHAFDALLAHYLMQGRDGINRVDYARWQTNDGDRRKLDGYLALLAARTPSAMTRNQAFAYWANLYNATTLKLVIDNYPIKSIRDIKSDASLFDVKRFFGPWRTKIATVEGRQVSLDDIEHEIMRPTFRDPRVHYSINCASLGCPNLAARAWRAETLDKDLDDAARAFINHPRGVLVRPDGSLRVSSIYKWFKEDFGGTDAGVIAHLRRYAGPSLSAKLPAAVQSFDDDYDWGLNQVDGRV
jgi:hypothetical protein